MATENLSTGFSDNFKFSEREVLNYIKLMINKSMFSQAIEYINQIKLPPISFSTKFHLNIMEQFIKLLIYQGYIKKAESVVIKVKNRAFDLELVDLYNKLNVWDSVIKKSLNQSYASVPIFESLDIFYDDIEDDLVKVMILLTASHLPDFIASQEHFLTEANRILSETKNKSVPDYPYIKTTVMNAMGVFQGLLGDIHGCKSILEATIDEAKEIGDVRRTAGSMTNLAYLYFLDGSMTPESQLMGRSMLQDSIKLSEEIGALEYQMITNLHLAEYYKNRGKAKLAIPYYNRVYEIQKQRGIMEGNEKIDAIFAKAINGTSEINPDVEVVAQEIKENIENLQI